MERIITRTKAPFELRNHQYTLMRAMNHETAALTHRIASIKLNLHITSFSKILEEILEEASLATV